MADQRYSTEQSNGMPDFIYQRISKLNEYFFRSCPVLMQ